MKEIMERYSTTFFECVQDWPDDIKADIYRLYAYLRAMDEIVEHNVFHPEWTKICEEFEKLEEKYSFDKQWCKDFDKSMISDLHMYTDPFTGEHKNIPMTLQVYGGHIDEGV